ncbi:MAG: hypothetical protein Q8886_02740, partial [Candidatus Phytoplasma australasiaticum]|nr:hypothetical protein [Candidatus Phytoplasma australasiaticum]
MFDEELQLFVIKRFDGVQYVEKDKKKFNSFPKSELRDLAKLDLINRGHDDFANMIQNIIRRETRADVFEEIIPAKGRFVVNNNVIDSVTGRPESKIVYPPIEILTKIPLKNFERDILQDLYVWAVDTETGESVMYRKNDEVEEGMTEILRIFYPTQMANLSEKDLEV